MPVSTPQVTANLAASLGSVGMTGIELPKICLGVANGVTIWVPQIVVTTVDTGTAGVGSGGPIPVLVPVPALQANLQAGCAAGEIIGIYSSMLVTGLATGLAQSFLQMFDKTTHAGVGTGAGVGKYVAPPATPSMLLGLSSAGITGIFAARLATAIGSALDTTFASLVVPVPIAGSASPTAATGSGVGNII